MIEQTKPSLDDPKAKDKRVGKLHPKIVRALIKLIKADTEYEIACVYNYVEHLKHQIIRLETIEKWDNEMQRFDSEKNKKIYLREIRKTLESQETLDNYKTILEEYRNAYKIRKENINLLYEEVKKIKKLEC